MEKKRRFDKEVKLKAVKEYENGLKSFVQLGNELRCDKSVVRRWFINYEAFGDEAFDKKSRNKSYTKELKFAAIQGYLNGLGSMDDIAKKYGIYGAETLRKWILRYNSHKEIKDYNPQGDIYMTKSRKKTYEEKLEVVRYCLEHKRSYKITAAHFDLSYSQVYQWVKKYDANGKKGLLDGRGRTKHKSELSETEMLKLEIERLENKNERLQMENDVLKKLEEIERRLYIVKSDKKRNI